MDLGALYRITSVLTHGKYSAGSSWLPESNIYISSFGLEYRIVNGVWTPAQNADGNTVFTANTDGQNTIENHFNVEYFEAKFMRLTILSAPSNEERGTNWGLMGCLVDENVTPSCPPEPCVEGEVDLVDEAEDSQLSASSVGERGEVSRSKFSGDRGWRSADDDTENPWMQVGENMEILTIS